jgi:hypothetical protein
VTPLAVAVGAVCLLAPFCAYLVGPVWPDQIRSRLIILLACTGAAMAVWVCPGLGVLLALTVARWRDPSGTPPVLVLTGAILFYSAILYGPSDVPRATVATIVVAAAGQGVWAARDLYWYGLRQGYSLHSGREAARASMGNRVLVSAFCAVALPLAPWWAMPPILLGLAATCSYTGIAAAGLGLLVAHPTWWPGLVTLAVIAAIPLGWWRGHPRDSARERLLVWRLIIGMLYHANRRTRWFGHGPGTFEDAGRWWATKGRTLQVFKHAHNDLMHVAYEHGLLGAGAMVVWAAGLTRAWAWGDPLTGAAVAAVVTMMAQFPAYLPQTGLPILAVAALLARRLG